MARKATLRASDDDRELVAERLRQATAEGRLLAHELEHRLGAALTARTYGELDSLVADLPSSGSDKPVRRGRRSHGLVPVGPAAALGLVLVIPIVVALVIA